MDAFLEHIVNAPKTYNTPNARRGSFIPSVINCSIIFNNSNLTSSSEEFINE